MLNVDMETVVAEAAGLAADKLDTSKLLGFRHIEADATDEGFAKDAAAAFNKIGGPNGEGPPSCIQV